MDTKKQAKIKAMWESLNPGYTCSVGEDYAVVPTSYRGISIVALKAFAGRHTPLGKINSDDCRVFDPLLDINPDIKAWRAWNAIPLDIGWHLNYQWEPKPGSTWTLAFPHYGKIKIVDSVYDGRRFSGVSKARSEMFDFLIYIGEALYL